MKKKNEKDEVLVAKTSKITSDVVENSHVIRVKKHERTKKTTTIRRNKSVVGDSIEIMMERLREGEGEESIVDRDLVYNDNEAGMVNPITNIRSDKHELMLEEKIGQYEHQHRPTMKVVKEEETEGDNVT